MPNDSGKIVGTLEKLVEISLTLVVGLGAIAISFNAIVKNKKIIANYFKQILILISISLLSFFLTFYDESFILENIFTYKLYISISGAVLILIVTSTTKFVIDNIDDIKKIKED